MDTQKEFDRAGKSIQKTLTDLKSVGKIKKDNTVKTSKPKNPSVASVL